MWFTLLVMALAVSVEPFRLGMTILMMNRPRPVLQLLVFLIGGYAMGLSVGLAVLFLFTSLLRGSTYVTLPNVQILLGAFAVAVGAALAANLFAKFPIQRAQRLLSGPSLWFAAVAGLGIALPSVDYLAALTVIFASRAPAATQVAALLAFNVVAFALVEIPLGAYLLAPRRTYARMVAIHNWIRARRRIQVAAALAAVGGVLLAVGFAGL